MALLVAIVGVVVVIFVGLAIHYHDASGWQTEFRCTICQARVSWTTKMHSYGRCPWCGRKGPKASATVMDTTERAYRLVRQGNWWQVWRPVRREYLDNKAPQKRMKTTRQPGSVQCPQCKLWQQEPSEDTGYKCWKCQYDWLEGKRRKGYA
jgi:DNA-directed RNA polymerase subunit RPC12/RpoP